MRKIRKAVPGVDSRLLIKDAAKLLPEPSRRAFLRGATGLGAVTLLTGCDIVDSASAEKALLAMSKFNDRVQALTSIRRSSRRPIRKVRSRGRFRSTLITR